METEQVTEGRRVLKRYSAEDRERLIKECEASGRSRREFCEQHGINLTTFHGWFQSSPSATARRGKKRKGTKAKKFVEMNVPTAQRAPIEVRLANGTQVGIHPHGTPEDLVALIRGISGYAGGPTC